MLEIAEKAREHDIYPTFVKFPMEIWGVLYKCSSGHYHIGINKNLTCEMQEKVLLHEIEHIKNDIPNSPYIIGLNMQHTELEQKADDAASELFGQL